MCNGRSLNSLTLEYCAGKMHIIARVYTPPRTLSQSYSWGSNSVTGMQARDLQYLPPMVKPTQGKPLLLQTSTTNFQSLLNQLIPNPQSTDPSLRCKWCKWCKWCECEFVQESLAKNGLLFVSPFIITFVNIYKLVSNLQSSRFLFVILVLKSNFNTFYRCEYRFY